MTSKQWSRDHEHELPEMHETGDDKHHFSTKALSDATKPVRHPARKGTANETHDVEEHIERQLTEIYENTDGSMPDMTRFEKGRRSRLLRSFFFLVFACLMLGAVALGGMIFFQPRLDMTEKAVALSIDGDEAVAVGKEVRYRIRYRNTQATPLTQARLEIRYPEGFVFGESSQEPTNELKNIWTLGTLEGHDGGYIDIFGTLYGDLGAKQSFRTFFNYIPANFNSEFQSVASLTTDIVETPATVAIEPPPEAVLGKETSFTVLITRSADYTLPLALEMEAPQFRFTKAVPAPETPGIMRWNIASTTESRIVVYGIFDTSDASDTVSGLVRVIGWRDAARATAPYTFASTSQEVKLVSRALSTQVVINGSTSDITVQPGESLNTSIAFKNTDAAPLDDVQVRIVFDAPSYDNKSMLNWAKLESPQEGAVVGEQLNVERRRGSITWSKVHIPTLQRLDSGEEILIDFRLPIKSNEDVTDLTVYPSGEITATAEVRYTKNKVTELLTATPLRLVINSDLSLRVEDAVTTDQAGKEVHLMNWIVNNTYHDLENIRLEAELYGDITWLPELKDVPAGAVEYQAAEKKLLWTIPTMPTSLDVLALQFGIVVNTKNPSQTQLTSKVRLRAKDTITGQEIVKVGDEILLTEIGN